MIKDTKKQILDNIEKILSFDYLKLLPIGQSVSPWKEMDNDSLKIFVEKNLDILKKIKEDHKVFDDISIDHLNGLNNSLNNFINNYQQLNNLDRKDITSHHHNCLNDLEGVNNLLRKSGLYTQLKLSDNFDETLEKIKEANNQLKSFDPESFLNAINLVDELTKQKSSFEEKTIKESLGTFINNANSHKIHRKEKFFSWKISGHWWWLVFSLLMGLLVGFIIFYFIDLLKDEKNISAGVAILRVSALAVPSYFMVFFINQFSYHQKMYESYNFKNTSMNMMTDLMKTNNDKADKILEKGLNILFSEPSIKEGVKYNKQLTNELLTIVKDQVNK